jgi:hypothetical protein
MSKDPDLASLLSDARFQSLVAQVQRRYGATPKPNVK